MSGIDHPIFIAGPARSGTSLLFSILLKSSELWSPYREMHGMYEWDRGLSPDFTDASAGTSGRDDNVLTDRHATPRNRTALRNTLYDESFNVEFLHTSPPVGSAYHLLKHASRAWKRIRSRPIRTVDKNPKHCFRTSFLKAVFPDAKFVFLYRRPEANISSLIEGWKSGKYSTYRLSRSDGEPFQWHFGLPPGWMDWIDVSLTERCARQWVGYTRALLDAERTLPDGDVVRCHYEDLVEHPLDVARSVFGTLDIAVSSTVRKHCRSLPVVNAVSSPAPDKWRKREADIRSVAPIFRDVAEEVGYSVVA